MSSANFPLMKVSEIKLTYQSHTPAVNRPACHNSELAHAILRKYWDAETIELYEEFVILLLDRRHRCMGIYPVSSGSSSGTVIDAKRIFSAALKGRADSIIIVHNHPSGSLYPSQADKNLTDQLEFVGRMLELPIQDHLILAPEGGYFSFRDSGMIGVVDDLEQTKARQALKGLWDETQPLRVPTPDAAQAI